MKTSKCIQLLGMFALIAGFVLGLLQARALAGITPPSPPPFSDTCNGVDVCDPALDQVCKVGHQITLTGFEDAQTADSGMATYTYTACSPLNGTCTAGPNDGETCDSQGDCNFTCNTSSNHCIGISPTVDCDSDADCRACASSKCVGTDIDCTTDDDCVFHCSRECSDGVEMFRPLNRFDVAFPLLADTSCLSGGNEPLGTCTCLTADSSNCDVDENIMIGDKDCFPNTCEGWKTGTATCVGTGSKTCSGGPLNTQPCNSANDCNPGTCSVSGEYCFTNGPCDALPVASCTNVTALAPGDCVEMTLHIPGETSDLGVGPIVVVDRESNDCTSACMQGPSCDVCEMVPEGEQCITRTLGFWGTHPWITNNYVPVEVCGQSLTCDGLASGDDPKSNPVCEYGNCDDVMEGLGSIGGELNTNAPYVAMIKQLTTAKLNLSATETLFDASCSSFCCDLSTGNQVWPDDGECPAGSQSIQELITTCEGKCDASKKDISGSGCIECLDAFNKSRDVIYEWTPSPFDQPQVDDSGNISGADPSSFTAAQKNKKVIGKGAWETCP